MYVKGVKHLDIVIGISCIGYVRCIKLKLNSKIKHKQLVEEIFHTC